MEQETEPGYMIQPGSSEMPAERAPNAEQPVRLQIFGEIARGGMGAVLKGRDPDLGRDLAVKVLLEAHRDRPELVRRFLEEAQITGQLQHPGIIPVYELGAFPDQRPYLAMKLVKGCTLAALLADRDRPSIDQTRFLGIFEQVAQTVGYAHARGVIHRDLKPSNIMVGSFGEVQVMDWGLAKVLRRGGIADDASAGKVEPGETVIATAGSSSDADLSQAGSILGTPAYMSPEQARGETNRLDERCDVFALGSILCEILTGQPAFTGRTSSEIQRKAAKGDLAEALERLDTSGADSELVSLAKSCLAPEHVDRLRDAGEVASRIAAYHSGVRERLRAAELERARAEAKAVEELKRRRLGLALAASILGLVLLGSGGAVYLARARAARQAATDRIVSDKLDRAILLRGQAKAAPIGELTKWDEALAAAAVAKASLEAGEPSADVAGRVSLLAIDLENERNLAIQLRDQQEADRQLFEELEEIRYRLGDEAGARRVGSDEKNATAIDHAFGRAFSQRGINPDQFEPAELGKILRGRSRPQEFAAWLDEWTLTRRATLGQHRDGEPWKRLIRASRATDDDPWRNQVRMLLENGDAKGAAALTSKEAELNQQPARSLYLLAETIKGFDVSYPPEAKRLLETAWRLSPDDYRIAARLGEESETELDRLRFSTAAVAANPRSPFARKRLADCLMPENPDIRSSFYADGEAYPHIIRTAVGAIGRKQLSDDYYPAPGGRVFFTYGDLSDGYAMSVEVAPDKSRDLYGCRVAVPDGDDFTNYLGFWPAINPETMDPHRLEQAVGELRKAVELAPKSGYFRACLAELLIHQRRFDEAMHESQAISEYEPQFRQGPVLGRAFYTAGAVDLALQMALDDAKRDPDGHTDDTLLGLCYHERGETELAAKAYRRALLATPADALVISLAAIGLRATGQSDDLIALYRTTLNAHPELKKDRFRNLRPTLAALLKRQGSDRLGFLVPGDMRVQGWG